MNLSASDVSLAISDPFGLWHNHHGDQSLKDPIDEYDTFLKEQGLRIELELLNNRHASFVNLKNESFGSAVVQTTKLLRSGESIIYGGALQSERLGLRARPDVIKVDRDGCIVEEYKLAGTPEETHKIQALFYSYVLKKEYGVESQCKVVSRLNEEFVIPYNEQQIEKAIQRTREIIGRDKPPFPIYNCRSEWSTLQNKTAKEEQNITLAWNVGAVVARRLHEMGIHDLEDLAKMDPNTLRAIPGLGPKKIPQVLNSARAQVSQQPIKVGRWVPSENRLGVEIFLDLEVTSREFLYQLLY